ncbi:MAG: hypothetical protein GX242_00240 [Clostridiales bacterium]|nr:hypothetical protein [Clostridiales bacterium]
MKDNISQNPKMPFGPSDELQLYYNDAYMKERERFNNLFGTIEEDVLAPKQVETVYVEPSPDEFVSVSAYKKAKRSARFFATAAIVFAAAAVVFALKFFSVF